ncbi:MULTISPECIES: LacI family DNA-binding transcriptional regulator [Enterococcus]|uniref:LacI family DNA-binding transcriptional regulator n=1 Tax=Enterococcus TaxID=1350 RepID=UPI0010FF9201|nr:MULTISPECIES: LacI family DNA-binding transcriptional regulator [Enterococcus]MBO6418832.1 LacI family DNA-binding transcriptional regulator [Enterococcus gallinarum]MBO6420623.1 LacI family DNA-binding transcriptional regulator [Enterococcus gallinarum]QCT90718.1 LacI family DNA-binding transcriptional regulator [Enterococcus sp. M190262]GMG57722.1 LacI family DNA-binding transcriptional regulator [Enterococcus gallinarum]
MATIRDIARMTGYSITTVSRVINDHPYVEEQKRQTILAMMKELNYKPNKIAQKLSSGKTFNVGVIVPFVNHPFFDRILNGIMEEAFAQQYKVTLLPTNFDKALEKDYLEEFAAKGFDGLIVITRANHIETFRPYLENGPIVFCEDASGTDVPFVTIDQVGSVTASILYLKEQGVKRLGLTLGRSKRLSCNSINTIAKAKELFPGFSEEDIFWDCIKAEDGEAAAVFFKDRGVDGIITNGDEIAATILSQYGERKAPLIIGQENLLISRLLNFSTVEFHLHLCGQEAFRLFQERSREQIVLPFELLVRS